MELKSYLIVLWRWLWLIVLATVVAAAISYWSSSRLPKVYSATTTLMVGQVLQSANPAAGDFTTSQMLAQSYVQLVRRQPVLQGTVTALGLPLPWQALVGQVSASALPNTQLIQIAVVAADPEMARLIADEVARQLILQSPTPVEREQEERRQFIEQQLAGLQARIAEAQDELRSLEQRLPLETSARGVQDIQGQMNAAQQKIATWQSTYANLLGSRGGRPNFLSVVDPATSSNVPVAPNISLNVMLAAVVGLALALAAILVIEYLDDSIKTEEDVERRLKLPFLGGVARISRVHHRGDELVVLRDQHSPLAESYRLLRTSLQCFNLDRPIRTLLMVSAAPSEGKSTTAANLAISLAQAGWRVILCDADLRRPTQHLMLGVSNETGLTSLLLDEAQLLEEGLATTAVPGLYVLPSGPLPPNPSELLGSERMKRRIAQMLEFADIVIVDGPAALPVADAMILGSLVDGALLVVGSDRTRTNTVQRGKASLERAGLRILGVVLNRIPGRRPSYQVYYTADSPRTREPFLDRWRRLTSAAAGMVAAWVTK